MSLPDDLDELARSVIDGNRYMTLATSEDDGRPRVSPVYFTHAGYRTFYWVSSPDARHSKNVAARPEVAIVIYDSSVEIGKGRAVYLDAVAARVPDDELPRRCAEAFAEVDPGAYRLEPRDLVGDNPWRLYHADATGWEVHLPGRDPRNPTGTDTRRRVTL
ncbi:MULTISPECIES: pyridoxamine 5'-phosphate oxidase family protein [Actinomadura]|uniref:Pyridoxamine 5'-phosphate oxidase n=1 Tax=Actinomadura madurae TaxID=1993 RepID=A0A1I4XJP2_9ACTN|nr:pyridoxamine 5'-phosphate oxidase family protein [Actinomadura madurae]SFN25460.1 Pyridoxamine 5'-phosphate oxidase [Actinomadura madurae]SPT63502.1 PPOX class probable F420-dependent enzyme [Actinomadura madurae]